MSKDQHQTFHKIRNTKKKKLKTIRIISGNQKDKFKKKHIIKVIFRKKECCKGDVLLPWV
jgi:hypothetical protein